MLKYEDVLKVDFGVQVNGRIVDSAFTLNWEPTYDELLLAAKEATEAGVKASPLLLLSISVEVVLTRNGLFR